MKFEVRVGETIIVFDADEKEKFSWKKVGAYIACAIIIATAIAAVGYGVATGDWSKTAKVADQGTDVIKAVAKAAAKSKE